MHKILPAAKIRNNRNLAFQTKLNSLAETAKYLASLESFSQMTLWVIRMQLLSEFGGYL
jgi:hypothetical protein